MDSYFYFHIRYLYLLLLLLWSKKKWPEQRLTPEFRHDANNFLFAGKGKPVEQRSWTLFEEQHFSKCKLPTNWNCLYDQHVDGVKMRFPVKMRTFLGRSPGNFQRQGETIVEVSRSFTVKVSISFIKVPSSCCQYVFKNLNLIFYCG